MVKATSLIVKAGSGLRFSFGVRAWTEMEIRCIKGMYRLKLISCKNNSGFKGLTQKAQGHTVTFYYMKCAAGVVSYARIVWKLLWNADVH